MKYFFLSLIVLIGFSSCYEKYVQEVYVVEDEQELDFLEIGRSLTYRVDSFQYQELYADSQTHSVYYIKEEILDTFRDAENNLSYYVVQYIKSSLNGNYRTNKIISYTRREQYLVRQEDNADLAILSFPLLNNIKWNPMVYTNTDFLNIDQLYPTQIIWQSEVINMALTWAVDTTINDNAKLDSCIEVSVANIENGGTDDYTDVIKFYDIYKKGIGPIYKEREAYVKRTSIANKRGYRLVYNLVSYE